MTTRHEKSRDFDDQGSKFFSKLAIIFDQNYTFYVQEIGNTNGNGIQIVQNVDGLPSRRHIATNNWKFQK